MCSLEERALDQLGEDIATLAAQLTVLTAKWLTLVAAFDRRAGWAHTGARSCAEWLAWRCALSPGAARDQLRVARSLQRLPRVASLFARGELSYSKVRALSRLDDVAFEDELIGVARHATAAELERIVRGHRGVLALEADAAAVRSRRFVALDPEEDGSVRLSGRLEPEEAAVLEAALEQARAWLWSRERADEDPVAGARDDPVEWHAQERRRSTLADAIVLLADTALSAGGPNARASAERHQVVVHVDAATLLAAADVQPAAALVASGMAVAGDAAHGGVDDGSCTDEESPVPRLDEEASVPQPRAQAARGQGRPRLRPAHLADGNALAPSVLRRLCCDATVVGLVHSDGTPLDVGRRTRTIPPALRRALVHRDQTCRFPGCRARSHLDAHHIEHWANGGTTDAANLVLLCRRHHRALHEGGFTLGSDDDGELLFRAPNGDVLPSHPALPCQTARTRSRHRRRLPRSLATGDALPHDHDAAVELMVRIAPPPSGASAES